MALVQESSTNADKLNTLTDPWDTTIAVPAASDRILLDFISATDGGSNRPTTVVVDPAGTPKSLGVLAFEQSTTTGCEVWILREADFPAAASYTDRADWAATNTGMRQIVALSGAEQGAGGVVFDGDNGTTGNRVCTLNGDFPAGTRVYGICTGNSSSSWTVSGDATEVRDVITEVSGDNAVYAEGVLTEAKSTVSITFSSSGNNRMAALMVVVLPVSAPNLVQASFGVFNDDGAGLGEAA